jgi:hypothetical protein
MLANFHTVTIRCGTVCGHYNSFHCLAQSLTLRYGKRIRLRFCYVHYNPGYTLFRQSFHGIVVDKIPSGQRRSRNRHSTRKSHSILPYCNQKSMDKKPRGSYESVIDRTDGISIVRWVDNSTVTAASSCFGVEPITNVRRYSQAEKQHIQVPRPNIIGKYSQSMGGNDQMDENTSQYRIAVKGKNGGGACSHGS